MAESTVALTVTDMWDDGQRIQVLGTIALGASPGTYSAGGVALNPATKLAGAVPGVGAEQPVAFRIHGGKAGYKYEYDAANKKMIVRQPTFTVKNGTIGANMSIGLTADAVTASVVGGTGITADRTLTTNQPVVMSEIPAAAMPAAVSGDVIEFHAIFKKFR